jgi:hypothetical protein
MSTEADGRNKQAQKKMLQGQEAKKWFFSVNESTKSSRLDTEMMLGSLQRERARTSKMAG